MRTVAGLLFGCMALAQAHPMGDPFSDPDLEYRIGSLWHSEDDFGVPNHANLLSWDGDGPTVWHWMRGKTGGLAGWLNPWQEGTINIIVSCWCDSQKVFFAIAHIPYSMK